MNFLFLFIKYILKILFSNKPFVVNVDNVKLLLPPHSLDVLIPAETFLDKNYEPLFRFKRNPKYIVDLGAHVGDFTIWASKYFNPSKIISVEMDKFIYRLFIRNLKINNIKNNILTINKAVHLNNNKTINIRKIPILTAASLAVKEEIGTSKVKTISLEEIIKLSNNKIIDYLKIDIEGAERYLLTDKYKEFFKKKVRFVAIECHRFIGTWPSEAEEYFKSIGYKTKFQRITALNVLNKLLHAKNQNL